MRQEGAASIRSERRLEVSTTAVLDPCAGQQGAKMSSIPHVKGPIATWLSNILAGPFFERS
jgi:hypothetical protein